MSSRLRRPSDGFYRASLVRTRRTGDDGVYVLRRAQLTRSPLTKDRLPRFVRACQHLSEFWGYIQPKFAHYAERTQHIIEELAPLLSHLESSTDSPADMSAAAALSTVDWAHVQDAWHRAKERQDSDPEGAITAARTLLEAVCKHILDERAPAYDQAMDLPQLYRAAAKELNLAPEQHQDELFKQILGGCLSVVNGLAGVRNRLSDAHGKSKSALKPGARHAELAVNLAGTMASFLIATHEWRPKS